ncbi:UNVERIFIED_CONTAM: Caffeic acid 3-O-methyltransferase [Sesamum radiatum]|uniref:Caffeic acid 3-O-methyltransferase n=1 Tax=Sesamum radiatum TaxID=300843 RepID=A0AAW2PXH4_SESRA
MENVHHHSNDYKHGEDEEAGVLALAACVSHFFPMALDAAIQLDLFEIIARAGGGAQLSPSDIVSQLPTTTTEQPPCLIACSGCWPSTLCLLVLLKDAVLGGGNFSERNNGKSYYDILMLNPEHSKMFNDAMGAHSTVLMRKVVNVYDGFASLGSIVDVGGGTGTTLAIIITKYPSTRGINFDLPQVLQTAPSYNSIEHIGGDMFVEVPKGDAIFLKYILHNWGDEKCIKLLNNCYEALPNKGKLIVMDYIFPNSPQTDVHAKYASGMDIIMSTMLEGKERTKDEFETLAIKAKFSGFKVVCYVYGMWIMEFVKSV